MMMMMVFVWKYFYYCYQYIRAIKTEMMMIACGDYMICYFSSGVDKTVSALMKQYAELLMTLLMAVNGYVYNIERMDV